MLGALRAGTAREYENPDYFAVHGLTVDTYAVQHPGSPGRRQAQSVFVHLITLCLTLERGVDGKRAVAVRERAVAKAGEGAPWLEPPDGLGELTVRDVLAARDAAQHAEVVRRWAEAVWAAWDPQHERVRGWVEEAL